MQEPEPPPVTAEDLTPTAPVVDQYVPAAWSPPEGGRARNTTALPPAHPRRLQLPIMLFVATCLSAFWVGACNWVPLMPWQSSAMEFRRTIVANWQTGLAYMVCVLAILFAHEMGHFIATLIYRIPASFPYFIPLPISPIGTMGAVIGMDGLRANRRQMFDIGLAGPLAGMVIAVPVMCLGIMRLNTEPSFHGSMAYDCPLLVRWLFSFLRPGEAVPAYVYHTQLNPYFMAGWVGFLITGLNMFPISQLDGGHVVYALFLKRAHLLARAFLFAAILFIVVSKAYMWVLMVILVILLGTDHPPTANDNMPLGRFRTALGLASLALSLLCFPAHGMIETGFWR